MAFFCRGFAGLFLIQFLDLLLDRQLKSQNDDSDTSTADGENQPSRCCQLVCGNAGAISTERCAAKGVKAAILQLFGRLSQRWCRLGSAHILNNDRVQEFLAEPFPRTVAHGVLLGIARESDYEALG